MNSSISSEQAALELLRRRKARTNLVAFTRKTFPQYRPAWFHELIAEHLQKVERGEIDRLMVNMPPRSGKSELVSKRFPAWFLGRNPGLNVIASSYNQDLARDFGRHVRNIVKSTDFQHIFPGCELSEDSKAADRWNTNEGGAYVAAGIGTAITGRGADLLLIDDPIKNREEADSERIRNSIVDWYSSVAYTRLHKGGRIILVQTRWHEGDLTGHLLTEEEHGGDKWVKLTLPAINEKGEALWPDEFPLSTLERIRSVLVPRDWSALYQQRPAPDEGSYFKREWFGWYEKRPEYLRVYGASDYAVTDGGGDYTVHVVAGVDADDNLYVLDVWRGQTTSDKWIDAYLKLVQRWKPLMWVEEQGQIIKSIGPFLEKRMREEKIYCRREAFTSVADKPSRSRSIQARSAMGKVFLPHNAPWIADFMQELLVFPAGKHDDQVDAFALIGRVLDKMVGGKVPQVAPQRRNDKWEKAFAKRERDAEGGINWRTL